MINPLYRKKINLDIFNKCTLECSKCARQEMLKVPGITTAKFPGSPMTHSEFDKLLNFYDEFSFCGQISDPMAHPNLNMFLERIHAEGKGSRVHTALSQPPLKNFIKCWEANPNGKWVFALDGLPKDSHKYRINQDGEKLYNIMKESLNYLDPHNIWWQCIVFAYNENDIEEVKRMAADLGVKLLLTFSGRFSKNDPLEPTNNSYKTEWPEWKKKK